jgi:hypothetical protein
MRRAKQRLCGGGKWKSLRFRCCETESVLKFNGARKAREVGLPKVPKGVFGVNTQTQHANYFER